MKILRYVISDVILDVTFDVCPLRSCFFIYHVERIFFDVPVNLIQKQCLVAKNSDHKTNGKAERPIDFFKLFMELLLPAPRKEISKFIECGNRKSRRLLHSSNLDLSHARHIYKTRVTSETCLKRKISPGENVYVKFYKLKNV